MQFGRTNISEVDRPPLVSARKSFRVETVNAWDIIGLCCLLVNLQVAWIGLGSNRRQLE